MKKNTTHDDNFDKTREQLHRQMLSTVSHDLKTPLATIIGSLEIYRKMGAKLSEEKQNSLISSALMEAYRLDSFITNILDMAKLEGGMVKVNQENCDIKSLLQDSIIRLGSRRDKLDISFKPFENHAHVIRTDPVLLSRAIGLLLDNAIKHGGKPPAVIFEYGVRNHKAIISISDNGAGIPKDQEKKIFSKYTRLSKRDQHTGTGLGLAICKEIMQTLSGEVKLESNTEKGCTFLLTVPAQ